MKALLTSLSFLLAAVAQTKAVPPRVVMKAVIHAPIERVFAHIVPVDLTHIFKKHKRLPAVVGASVQTGWTTPGLVRTVYFEDGTTAREHLLTVVGPTSFSYQITQFTSELRFLARRVDGSWRFTDLGDGSTRIEWTYQVVPKHFVAHGLLRLLVLNDLRGYLTNALNILKSDLEKPASLPGTPR